MWVRIPPGVPTPICHEQKRDLNMVILCSVFGRYYAATCPRSPIRQRHTLEERDSAGSNPAGGTSDPVHQAFGGADGSSYLPARQERDVSTADEVLRTLGIFLERCPSGLWCRFRKPVGASPVGSNPTLSAIRAPVVQ